MKKLTMILMCLLCGISFEANAQYYMKLDASFYSNALESAQPFIEHGMKHKKETGHIDIHFQLSGDLIIFEVEDDGIGREKAGEIKSKQSLNHQSMATAITLDRLKVLNKKLKKKIELRIMDLKNESGIATGTKVVMEIPFEVA